MEERLKTVLDEVRGRLTPQGRSEVPNRFRQRLVDALSAVGLDAVVLLGGSWAKDTFLPGDHDVDVFVRFSPAYPDSDLSNLLERSLVGFEGFRRIHGSRDYFQLDWEGFAFELVPVRRIDSPEAAVNVTDMSPMHVKYVCDRIEKNPGLAAEIRLAKRFCKTAKVYGAESYIDGFSGHVVDLLVLHFGSFLSLLEAASSWEPQVVFGEGDLAALNPAKCTGPLVIFDPVQPGRNAAAAVALPAFERLREWAGRFLASPDASFFEDWRIDKEYVENHWPDKPFLFYRLIPVEGSKDVVGTKCCKVHGFVLKQVQKGGFTVLAEGFDFDGVDALCFVVVEEERLPAETERLGPPLVRAKDCAAFLAAHPGAEERNGRLVAFVPVHARTLRELFDLLVREPFVCDRVAGTKVL